MHRLTARAYHGRTISVNFHSTPQLYVAIFENEYDGAPDSCSLIGRGRTEEAAVADLLEQEAERFDV